MNLIPMIAKELGVEVGEKFRIKWPTCKKPNEEFYKFTKDGFIYYDQAMCEWIDSVAYVDLISGKAEVVQEPFEPKEGEQYFYITWEAGSEELSVFQSGFYYCDMCCHHKYCGNCFRTREEAEAHKCEVYERLTGKKWVHESTD